MSRPYERKTAITRSTLPGEDQWYVLHVLSNKERRAVEGLTRLFTEDEELRALWHKCLVPTEKVEDLRNGKKYIVERKLYPGYVYLNFELRRPDGSLNNDAWYKIQAVDGVISFACGRSKEPVPMSTKDVTEFLSEVARRSGVARPKICFNVNDIVSVLDGPFQGQRGKVTLADPATGKLRVDVSIFGRDTPVDLDYSQVQVVPDDELEQD